MEDAALDAVGDGHSAEHLGSDAMDAGRLAPSSVAGGEGQRRQNIDGSKWVVLAGIYTLGATARLGIHCSSSRAFYKYGEVSIQVTYSALGRIKLKR